MKKFTRDEIINYFCYDCEKQKVLSNHLSRLGSKGGKKSKRTISPEQQAKMQAGRRQKKYVKIAKALYTKSPGENLPTQKYKRGQRVKVADKMPSHMAHFEAGVEAIIEYTYAQKFWGDDVDSYSIIVLDNNGNPIGSIAWYHEDQLTLLDEDVEPGLKIIESYTNTKKKEEI